MIMMTVKLNTKLTFAIKMKRYKSIFESQDKVPEHPVIKIDIPGTDIKYQVPGYFHNASNKPEKKLLKKGTRLTGNY